MNKKSKGPCNFCRHEDVCKYTEHFDKELARVMETAKLDPDKNNPLYLTVQCLNYSALTQEELKRRDLYKEG